ncbi:MAG: hypothetical protein ACJAZS_000514 [Alteromonas naphthalenivorans]
MPFHFKAAKSKKMYCFICNHKKGDLSMQIDTDLKNLMIVVAIAVLIPLTVRYGDKAFKPKPVENGQRQAQTQKSFLIKGGIGAACLFAGAKMTPAVLGTGVFVGGLVVLLKNVRCYWPNLDVKSQFFLLLAALFLIYFLVKRKHGGLGGLRKPASRGRKK